MRVAPIPRETRGARRSCQRDRDDRRQNGEEQFHAGTDRANPPTATARQHAHHRRGGPVDPDTAHQHIECEDHSRDQLPAFLHYACAVLAMKRPRPVSPSGSCWTSRPASRNDCIISPVVNSPSSWTSLTLRTSPWSSISYSNSRRDSVLVISVRACRDTLTPCASPLCVISRFASSTPGGNHGSTSATPPGARCSRKHVSARVTRSSVHR